MSSNNKSASENKARKKKNKPNNKKVQNLSNVLKPDNMELTEWQKALRRQVADADG